MFIQWFAPYMDWRFRVQAASRRPWRRRLGARVASLGCDVASPGARPTPLSIHHLLEQYRVDVDRRVPPKAVEQLYLGETACEILPDLRLDIFELGVM